MLYRGLVLSILIRFNKMSFIGWSFHSTRITREVCVGNNRRQLIDFARRQLDLQRHESHIHKISTSLLSRSSYVNERSVNERSVKNLCTHLVAGGTGLRTLFSQKQSYLVHILNRTSENYKVSQ